MDFKIESAYKPTGDQPQAIEELCDGLKNGADYQTLLGVTGSGKTFTMANVIERVNRPTLILSHNKTLAAQLYAEFKSFFPKNAVHYFVSYYDYYQPEAYIPSSDKYIEKDLMINRVVPVRHWQSGGLRQERSRNKSGTKNSPQRLSTQPCRLALLPDRDGVGSRAVSC